MTVVEILMYWTLVGFAVALVLGAICRKGGATS